MTDNARKRFKPHKTECVQCGELYMQTDPRQKLCSGCRQKNIKDSMARYETETYTQVKRGRPKKKKYVPPPPDTSHICEVSGTCDYGKPDGEDYNCNYFTVTGRLRTEGGLHQIRDGKCDLYKRRTRNRSGWQRERDGKLEKEVMNNDNMD